MTEAGSGRRDPRRRRRWIAGVTGALLAVGAAWAGGLIWFAGEIPRRVEDPMRPTDAIVVLTGGSGRLTTGLELLAEKRAKKLFVSGVWHGVDMTELLRISRQAPEEVACCVVLGYSADDTAGNAGETASWMRAEGYRSLRLVTANYHMRRALLEFQDAMPEVTVIPHPVFPAQPGQGEWWPWPGPARLIIGEYNKYLAAVARRWAIGPSPAGAGK